MNHHDYREPLHPDTGERFELAARRTYAKHARDNAKPVVDEPVSLRLCRVHDDPALERLAQLEGTRIRSGRYVIAEVSGTIVAAQPLDGGAPIADPFRKTTQVLPLLALRVEQLAGPANGHPGRHVLSFRRGFVRL